MMAYPVEKGAGSVSPIQVLIVDDSPIVRMVVMNVLRKTSIPLRGVFQAANGKDALDILYRERIDVVLADINMPLMSGAEMIDAMASDGSLRNVPVIIISSEGSLTRIEQLKSKGALAFIRKPFSQEFIGGILFDVLGLDRGMNSPQEIALRVLAYLSESYGGVEFAATEAPPEMPSGDTCHSASMSFHGAAEGRIALVMPLRLCREITGRLLHADPMSQEEETAKDALRELVSMTCAHTISEALGEDAICSLLPEWNTQPVTQEIWNDMLGKPCTRSGILGGYPILLFLEFVRAERGVEGNPMGSGRSPRMLKEEELGHEF